MRSGLLHIRHNKEIRYLTSDECVTRGLKQGEKIGSLRMRWAVWQCQACLKELDSPMLYPEIR